MFLNIFNSLKAEYGLNDRQFAIKSGIPYTTVRGWTALGRLPDHDAIIKIADFFGVSADYLLGIKKEAEDLPFDLNKEEKAIIKNYRECTAEEKKFLKDFLSSYVEKKKNGKK